MFELFSRTPLSDRTVLPLYFILYPVARQAVRPNFLDLVLLFAIYPDGFRDRLSGSSVEPFRRFNEGTEFRDILSRVNSCWEVCDLVSIRVDLRGDLVGTIKGTV